MLRLGYRAIQDVFAASDFEFDTDELEELGDGSGFRLYVEDVNTCISKTILFSLVTMLEERGAIRHEDYFITCSEAKLMINPAIRDRRIAITVFFRDSFIGMEDVDELVND